MHWIKMAQCKDQCRSVVNMLVRIHVKIKIGGNFLSTSRLSASVNWMCSLELVVFMTFLSLFSRIPELYLQISHEYFFHIFFVSTCISLTILPHLIWYYLSTEIGTMWLKKQTCPISNAFWRIKGQAKLAEFVGFLHSESRKD
jgi:hypothetical protein